MVAKESSVSCPVENLRRVVELPAQRARPRQSWHQKWKGNERVSDREKLDGFRRLEQFARGVETRMKPEANLDALVAHENSISRR